MEVLMICGSPRMGKGVEGCNSLYLLEQLKARLSGCQVQLLPGNPAKDLDRLAQALISCRAVVLGFPLYVDSIPSGLLETMAGLQQRLAGKLGLEQIPVYPVVNCGFFEGNQNRLALSMVWEWCQACGLSQGRGLAVGGGEMLGSTPMGRGPLTSLGKHLDTLAQDILAVRKGETLWTQPDFPRSFYRLAGNLGFRMQARKNGLSARQTKMGK